MATLLREEQIGITFDLLSDARNGILLQASQTVQQTGAMQSGTSLLNRPVNVSTHRTRRRIALSPCENRESSPSEERTVPRKTGNKPKGPVHHFTVFSWSKKMTGATRWRLKLATNRVRATGEFDRSTFLIVSRPRGVRMRSVALPGGSSAGEPERHGAPRAACAGPREGQVSAAGSSVRSWIPISFGESKKSILDACSCADGSWFGGNPFSVVH